MANFVVSQTLSIGPNWKRLEEFSGKYFIRSADAKNLFLVQASVRSYGHLFEKVISVFGDTASAVYASMAALIRL